MKSIKLLCFALLFTGATFAQEVLPSADVVLNNAYAQAAKENKKVILMFHASWCGWCKKMDASLTDPAIKKLIDDNYVIAHLDVMEQKDKSNLENPGGMDAMKKFGADEKAGLPFWLVLDSKGTVLANSFMAKGGGISPKATDNVGCPSSEKEVSFLDGTLKKTSNLKAEDIAAIHKRFLLNQPPPTPAKGTN